MGQQVNVDRELRFRADAAIQDNVKGDMSAERLTSVDWFDGKALDTTNDYTSTLGGTNDAIGLSAGGLCGVTVTTGSVIDDCAHLATALVFDISQNPSIETKIYITDVSATVIFFGFSDAVTEATQQATIDADGGTLAGIASDAVGFVIDPDLGTSSIYCASTIDSAVYQSVDTGLDWADTKSHILRVALDTSGNAYFYVDGVEEGYIATAVSDVPLCAMWNFGCKETGAQTVYARYLKKWQDVP